MISGKKVLAVITARGGSKQIPKKNIRTLGGKPLIAWSIEAAQNSKYIDKLILSSDSQEIIKVAKDLDCDVPFERPKELALDETPGVDPVLHAIEKLPGYDYVILLQPTSPFRKSSDIDECIELCFKTSSPSCVSVTETRETPYWMYKMDDSKHLKPLLEENFKRRQDLPSSYTINGAVYVADIKWFQINKTFIAKETIGFVMPSERSIDIDTEEDFKRAEGNLNHL